MAPSPHQTWGVSCAPTPVPFAAWNLPVPQEWLTESPGNALQGLASQRKPDSRGAGGGSPDGAKWQRGILYVSPKRARSYFLLIARPQAGRTVKRETHDLSGPVLSRFLGAALRGPKGAEAQGDESNEPHD